MEDLNELGDVVLQLHLRANLARYAVIAKSPIRRTGDAALEGLVGELLQLLKGVANDDLAFPPQWDFWGLLRVWKKGKLASSGHSDLAPKSFDISIYALQYSSGNSTVGDDLSASVMSHPFSPHDNV